MSSPPKVYIVAANSVAPSISYAVGKGWEVTSVQQAGLVPDLDTILKECYTGLIFDASYGAVSGPQLNVAYDAYMAGLSVMTTGNDTTTSSGNPLWASYTSAGPESGKLSPVTPVGSHPIAQGWPPYNDDDSRIYHYDIRSDMEVVATYTRDGSPVPAIYVGQAPSGARYIHAHPYSKPPVLWHNLLDWLNPGGGKAKVWDGSAWVYKNISVYNGEEWVKRPIKHFTGGRWTNI